MKVEIKIHFLAAADDSLSLYRLLAPRPLLIPDGQGSHGLGTLCPSAGRRGRPWMCRTREMRRW